MFFHLANNSIKVLEEQGDRYVGYGGGGGVQQDERLIS